MNWNRANLRPTTLSFVLEKILPLFFLGDLLITLPPWSEALGLWKGLLHATSLLIAPVRCIFRGGDKSSGLGLEGPLAGLRANPMILSESLADFVTDFAASWDTLLR